jgi:Protein of unknown function (DUF1822)
MLTLNDLTCFYPEQTSLELSQSEIDAAWQQVLNQAYSDQDARLRAFHNRLCLHVLSPLLVDVLELPTPPQPWLLPDELPSIWEVLNGGVLIANGIRLAIIPSDAVRIEELRVEREWVDIPELAAHYYVAVQVDIAKQWLRVLGYADHAQLKQAKNYDAIDQTYALDQTHLIDDLSLLWVSGQFISHKEPVIEPIAPLSAAAVGAIIQHLKAHHQFAARRILPFEQWPPIVAHPEWRQWLYHQRIQASEATATAWLPPAEPSLKVDLGNWARQIFTPEWLPVTELFTSMPAPATAKGIPTIRAKAITLGDYRVALIVSYTLEPRSQPTIGIQIEAKMLDDNPSLTDSLNLQVAFSEADGSENILTESLPVDAPDPTLKLPRLLGSPGEEFIVTLSLGTHNVIETFIL